MTDELKQKIPRLYEQEKNPDPIVHVKYFALGSHWTWYATEFDGVDILFGWCEGDHPELGYFSLKELESIKWGSIPRIERDIYFDPCPLSSIPSYRERQAQLDKHK